MQEPITQSINVSELSELLKQKADIKLIDVREADEFAFCKINNASNCPLSNLEESFNSLELDKKQKVVLYCHHGRRSQRALMMLQELGYENLINLEGGIDAWSLEIDDSVARY
ncbi:MAG: rhodanese-like domain-containing protein [Candidatus Caenarcaniphilales bacterium]|nr:rhodanese-like domain-containing protein [Candidatus Caenarcaniphilales bacterium]